MSTITQPSKTTSAWVRVPQAEQLKNSKVILDAEGRILLVGMDKGSAEGSLFYSYMTMNDSNFEPLKRLPVGFSGSGQQGMKVDEFQMVQSGTSPVKICIRNTSGQLFQKSKGPEDTSVNQWIPYINGGAFKRGQWGVADCDGNGFWIYGVTESIPGQIHYALAAYNGQKDAPSFGVLTSPKGYLNTTGGKGSQGDLILIAHENSPYTYQFTTAQINAPKKISTANVFPQVKCLYNGVILQFYKDGKGNLSGFSQADSLGALSTPIVIHGQIEKFWLVTDSLGIPSIFAIWFDRSIRFVTGNGPNGAFVNWETISSPGLDIVDWSVSRDFLGGFRTLVTLRDGTCHMCSTTVDDRIAALPDSKAGAKGQIDNIHQLTSQVVYKKGRVSEISATNTEVEPDISSPVTGAWKDIDAYKDTLVHWLKDVANAIGQEGFKLFMDAESIGKTMASHLHFNDFKPSTALDFLEAKDIRKLIDKGVDSITTEFDPSDYKPTLISEFSNLVDHMKNLTSLFDMPLPLDIHQLENHTLPMLDSLPGQVLEHLSRLLPNPDFSALGNAIDAMTKDVNHKKRSNTGKDAYKLERLFSPETIRIMAAASAACSIAASIINIVTKTLPLKLGLGINFVVGATAKGRAVAEVDVSAGVDAGVGVSVPVLGIGVFAGAGAGNGTLVKVDTIWIGLTAALLCPFSALCLSANTILEGMIHSNKQFVKED